MSRMRKGAVGRSWNADRKTTKLKPHIRKKRGVNSGGLAFRAGRAEVARAAPAESDSEASEDEDGAPEDIFQV